MKKIIYVLAVTTSFFALISCGDDCYECTIAGVTSTACEDDASLGDTITLAQAVVQIEEAGGTCKKK